MAGRMVPSKSVQRFVSLLPSLLLSSPLFLRGITALALHIHSGSLGMFLPKRPPQTRQSIPVRTYGSKSDRQSSSLSIRGSPVQLPQVPQLCFSPLLPASIGGVLLRPPSCVGWLRSVSLPV